MITIESADKALKTYYLDVVSNSLNTKINPLLAKFEQTSADVWGKEIRKVVSNGINGGFGAAANARGSAVYATNLYSGKESRYERRDVLGEIKPEHIPHWAMEGAARIREREKKRHEPER